MNTQHPYRTTCRVCGSSKIQDLFSLGNQYVSDFPSPEDARSGKLHLCDITLQMCEECTLVQQKYTAPQDFMFSKHYWYRSGTTATMRAALAEIVTAATSKVTLEAGDVVLDIGANDGTLLSNYKEGVVRVACEPAVNLRGECEKNCNVLINSFWSAEAYANACVLEGLAKQIWHDKMRAKVITAIGMFYDLEEPSAFISDVAKVLHPEGVFVCQLMCAKQTMDLGDVGNLAHEHLEFYTLRSLQRLFLNHRLEIFNIEENNVNGGSYRIYVRHYHSNTPARTADTQNRVHEAFWREHQMGLHSCHQWRDWAHRIETNKRKVIDFITNERLKGRRIWVYGASTKGNVILQYYGLDSSVIDGAADKSPEKWGRVTVGTNIPIKSEDEMRVANPDWLLVLPYAFLDEFLQRERPLLIKGTGFIVPLPFPQVVRAHPNDLLLKDYWTPQDRMPVLEVTVL